MTPSDRASIRRFALVLVPVSLIATTISDGWAQEPTHLRIATRNTPPFSMPDAAGTWQGISIGLWEDIARELDLTYEYVDMGLDEMIAAVAQGNVDAAVAALTVTADRERQLDFSHTFYASGLSIAVVPRQGGLVAAVLDSIFSRTFVQALAGLGLILFIAGALVWIFERHDNADDFGGRPAKGLGSGFWWAAVTMTTVGYGDKAPKTVGGRAVGLIWMFASIIMISGFTAGIASALTLQQLSTDIEGPEDLPGNLVGTLGGSTSEAYLQGRGAGVEPYANIEAALNGLAAGEVDAVVYDAPLLRYRVKEDHAGDIEVLPHVFQRQGYAIALPPGSPRRETINRILLERIAVPGWNEVLNRYLGSE